MALQRLRLVQHVFELALLELEVFLLERCLFTRLRARFLLTSRSLQHETLVYIRDEIVI